MAELGDLEAADTAYRQALGPARHVAHHVAALAVAREIGAVHEETATLTALVDLRRQQGAAAEVETLRARVRALRRKHRLPESQPRPAGSQRGRVRRPRR